MINIKEYHWVSLSDENVAIIQPHIFEMPEAIRNLTPDLYKIVITNFSCTTYFDDIFYTTPVNKLKYESACSTTGFAFGSKTRAMLDVVMDYLDPGIYVLNKDISLVQYEDFKSYIHDTTLLDDVEDLKNVDFK
jgi:hypothetical protein